MSCTKVKPLSSIRRLNLEVTNRCNANCVFCPRDKLTDRKQSMKLNDAVETIVKVYETAKSFGGLKLVNFGLFGEPTLHKDLVRLVAFCKNLRLKTRITTNAFLLDEHLGFDLMNAGLDVCNISVEATDKTTYEKIRKGLKWERVLNNITVFHNLREQHKFNTRIVIYPVKCKENKNRYEKVLEFWSNYSDSCRASPEVPLHRQSGRVKTWFLNDTQQMKRVLLSKLGVYSSTHCHDWFTVKVDGTVVACCLDYFKQNPLGNVFKQPIHSIFFGEPTRKFRENLVYGKVPPFCQKCRFLPMVRKGS